MDVFGIVCFDVDVFYSDYGVFEFGFEGGEVGVLCDDGLSCRIVL